MSNFKTLKELVQDVITELSMYRGTGTQKYAEDRIADKIVRTFIDVFEQRFWNFNTDDELIKLIFGIITQTKIFKKNIK